MNITITTPVLWIMAMTMLRYPSYFLGWCLQGKFLKSKNFNNNQNDKKKVFSKRITMMMTRFKNKLQWWWQFWDTIKMVQWQVDDNNKYPKSHRLWWFKTYFSSIFISFQLNPDSLHGFMYSSEIQWNVKSKCLCQIVIIISL